MRTSFSEGPAAAWRRSACCETFSAAYVPSRSRSVFWSRRKRSPPTSAAGAQGASLVYLTRGRFPSRQPSCPLRPSPPDQSKGYLRRLRMPCAAWIRSSRVLPTTTGSQRVSTKKRPPGMSIANPRRSFTVHHPASGSRYPRSVHGFERWGSRVGSSASGRHRLQGSAAQNGCAAMLRC